MATKTNNKKNPGEPSAEATEYVHKYFRRPVHKKGRAWLEEHIGQQRLFEYNPAKPKFSVKLTTPGKYGVFLFNQLLREFSSQVTAKGYHEKLVGAANSVKWGTPAKTNPAKTKKRTSANKKERTKKNGLLQTAATIAVGSSAALNVYDRLNRNTKTATPAATGAGQVLHHNKSAASDIAHHEREFEKLLTAIRNGDYSKIRSAKLQGKLANWSDREVEHFISQAKFTSRLKLNPTPAVIEEAESLLLKKNGIISRKWSQMKAEKAYRRQLKLESQLEKVKAKKRAAEKKAKKNPVAKPRRNPAVSKARQNCLLRFEEFQGRPSEKLIEVERPLAAPTEVWTLGTLLEIRLKGGKRYEFRRGLSGKKFDFLLCADADNKQMWICGGSIATPDSSIKDYFCVDVAEITNIIYLTEKHHLMDVRPTGYIHKLGEEGGKRPMLALDNLGFPIIAGGDYYITPLGIAD